eukprot:jgi/Galph1/3929/GphlegSOOS_G2628.1
MITALCDQQGGKEPLICFGCLPVNLKKYVITNSTIDTDIEKKLVLSHYELVDILKYLEATKERQHTCKTLENNLTVDLGTRYLEELQVSETDGLGLSLQPEGNIWLSWEQINSFLGIASKYRPFPWILYENKHQRINRQKIRPGILLWKASTLGIEVKRLALYSSVTNRPLTLVPIGRKSCPPTVIIGGFTMHRGYSDNNNQNKEIEMDPAVDTRLKVNSLGNLSRVSHVLDIGTGLGYTAIEVAHRCPHLKQLITIEKDPCMCFLLQVNPWSQALLSSSFSNKIERWLGDAVSILPQLPDNYFDLIIHDPPAQALEGDLYSLSFYWQMYRVLGNHGRLYHYIGNPNSKEAGRLYRGVLERLYKVGFSNVLKVTNAFGVVASKVIQGEEMPLGSERIEMSK